jgi:hypothetical protein
MDVDSAHASAAFSISKSFNTVTTEWLGPRTRVLAYLLSEGPIGDKGSGLKTRRKMDRCIVTTHCRSGRHYLFASDDDSVFLM